MTRMNWDRHRHRGKLTLSVKDEFERLKQQEDRWRRARRRNREHGQQSFEFRRPISTTVSSTEAPPW